MRKKGMKKAAAVLAATMVFSLFSEAGMAAPQTVQAATYQKTIKNKSVKKPEVLIRAIVAQLSRQKSEIFIMN